MAHGRSRSSRRWIAIAGSIVAHALLLLGLVIGVRHALDYAPQRAIEVRLEPDWIAPRPAHVDRIPAVRDRAVLRRARAAIPKPEPPVITPPPPLGAPAQPSIDNDLAAALRAGVGCHDAGLANLEPAERERCRERLASLRQGVPDLGIGAAALAVGEREAAWRADHASEGRVPFGCIVRFGPNVQRQAALLKLGPLPCYIGASRQARAER